MRRNTLGRSAVETTELGFGGAGIGNLYTPVAPDDALAAVDAAWERGVRAFDTAPHYGLGLSERRLGGALRSRPRDAYTLSTKAGRLLDPCPADGTDLAQGFDVPADHRRIWDFSADGIRRSIEDSLRRLGLDRIDVVYLHDPDDHAEQAFREGYPALERLRAEGVVGAIGAGMNQTAMLTRFLRDTDVDVVLCAGRHTLLDHSARAELLPEAVARGRSVVVGGVFNSGLLADPGPGATYDYLPAPERLITRARRIERTAARHGVPLRAAALHYARSHPAVACTLVGVRSAETMRDAADRLATPVPAALWDELRAEGLLPVDDPVGLAPAPGPAGGVAR
ncbi:aldo/keto reductase [Streptomyces clavuligerus]|uniref:aldo/keto reductase n=1 Tax=Streptomyces clavuligerus TaxID=1901 RepID=UPI0008106F1B|nr:aldo/keto reductase [Streptomyces clavuligerus]ANW17062.1 aldo/keto reductase [Streptomyces clavuligerus]AXU11597.1 aldo/keto reductase [Streptomyces clavuligerus]MBY6301419.1 aldo/keto reductase [Streptomyces clavuligerus]QPL61714.1 aldo/keto reductase [Streptomyces clavuligerus]QPL67746.1 aldo/keto reductase [Streptomyces clavuligerus]